MWTSPLSVYVNLKIQVATKDYIYKYHYADIISPLAGKLKSIFLLRINFEGQNSKTRTISKLITFTHTVQVTFEKYKCCGHCFQENVKIGPNNFRP